MFFNKNKLCILFTSSSARKEDKPFENIIGYDNVKRLFRMALESPETISILLSDLSA
jgi:hypothetical protein